MKLFHRVHPLAVLGPILAACTSPSATLAPTGPQLATAESLFADLRDLRDRIDVTLASGRSGSDDTAPVAALVSRHNSLRRSLIIRLATLDSAVLGADDDRALAIMRRALERDIDALAAPTASQLEAAEVRPDCGYDPGALTALPNGLDSLRARLYRCYSWAQSHLMVGSDTLDRLTVLGALGRTSDAARRRKLFLALAPVWRSINGDNSQRSPYRRLMAHTRLDPLSRASATGVPPDSLERWLVALLTAWREVSPDSLIQPWDWYYLAGKASRALSPRISRARMTAINAEVYRSLGADVGSLRVRYDLEPREGKTPVAYSTFGARPRFINGAWRRGEPWVFATYRTGGLDNLNELLHETGHAMHIAAIRTRPSFADWPDSDPFTEAIADFIALEVYEPAWQQRWLGDSVPLADGLRARYAGIVLDVAWALFEVQMQRGSSPEPNQVWTTLTQDYLRIQPHPELSWWAMRGQLVDAPGYMINYAIGAILIAAIRARTVEVHGSFSAGDPSWYSWIAPRLFRFGLEQSSHEVVEEFLGGPVTPAAILADIGRMGGPGTRDQGPGTRN